MREKKYKHLIVNSQKYHVECYQVTR